MSLTKCIRMTAIVRSLQLQSKHAVVVVPARQESRWDWYYTSKEGIPRDVMTMLSQDYTWTWKGMRSFMETSRWMALKEDHKFIPERHRVLGPDLATAHFLVKRGGRVKFEGRGMWYQRDKEGNMYLPNQFVPDLHLEAVDCTGMQMSYVAFDNMIQLEHLRYLNLSQCTNLDDWCLARLHQFQDSLEFLDLTDCCEVTENGLACLNMLRNLKGLKLTGLSGVRNLGLMVLLLEEALPQCTIFGVDPEALAVPDGASAGAGDMSLQSGHLQSVTGGVSTGSADMKS
ncbi:distal membrane-arm assembly complex protein 2-like [Babylonia areolata]|uniref:distal membrane-arm assembly complex protein 2-like n=1 Tax=Babylonia areolata TaxID=304850 RepID=UPI003FD559B1